MRPLLRSGFSAPHLRRSKLTPLRVRCYHRRRWSHKKNSSNFWPGKRPSNRSLKPGKKELLEAQRRQRDNLKRQIRRAQSRITAVERKHRTRRLILMGSYLEHVTGDDPGKQDSLIQGLDGFLERDRDRELFDLPGKENENGKPA